MAHNGDEYQIRINNRDGTEELSGWMNSTEQVAHAMDTAHRSEGDTYWLLIRSKGQITLESPIANIPSPRYRPHDSYYLMRERSRGQHAAGW